MPGDGITDVAPLTQQQWNGWYLTRSKKRPYGSQDVEGWIELATAWEVPITAQAQQQYLQPKARQSNVRRLTWDAQEGWLTTPTDIESQAAVGAVQHHVGIPTPKRRGLPQQYLAHTVPVEPMIDPAILNNAAAWLPAISGQMEALPRRVSSQTVRERNAHMQVYVLSQQPFTSHYAVTTTALGDVQYTGGGLVLQ